MKIKLNKRAYLTISISGAVTVGLSILFGFICWPLILVIVPLYVGTIATALIMMNKYAESIEKYNEEMKVHAKALGAELVPLTPKQIDELIKNKGTVLSNGDPITMEEMKYL